LSSLSTQAASRGYLSQLQALLTYYNKQIADTTKVFLILFRISIGKAGIQESLLKV